jgi:hypothetical protein
MGIEPTSEAWEASIKLQNVRIGGNLTFSSFSNGFQMEQRRGGI